MVSIIVRVTVVRVRVEMCKFCLFHPLPHPPPLTILHIVVQLLGSADLIFIIIIVECIFIRFPLPLPRTDILEVFSGILGHHHGWSEVFQTMLFQMMNFIEHIEALLAAEESWPLSLVL